LRDRRRRGVTVGGLLPRPPDCVHGVRPTAGDRPLRRRHLRRRRPAHHPPRGDERPRHRLRRRAFLVCAGPRALTRRANPASAALARPVGPAPHAERVPGRRQHEQQHDGRPDRRAAGRDQPHRVDQREEREEPDESAEDLEPLPRPQRVAARTPATTACHGQFLSPPEVSPETMRRWKISTMITSGTVTNAPAAMIAAYGGVYGLMPEKRAIATVTG